MTDKARIILKMWGAIMGALICGFPSYIFLTDSKIFYFVSISAGIGAFLGASIVFIILKLADKSVRSFMYYGLSGLVIGLLNGFFWTIITSIFTKWWEGWAFVVGLGICIFSGVLGLFGGIIGKWKITRILEGKSRLYKDKYLLSIAIGILIFLFIIVPIISRG